MTKNIENFLLKVSRSACLNQRVSGKCVCFSCEAKRLLAPPLSNIEFQAACGKYLVDPGLALENKEVLAAVKAGSLTALRSALLNEF